MNERALSRHAAAAFAVLAMLVCSCGDESPARDVALSESQPAAPTTTTSVPFDPEAEAPIFFDSMRDGLEGYDASILATVVDLGRRPIVRVDRVFSPPQFESINPSACNERLGVGLELELVGSLEVLDERLVVGSQGLFLGNPCDEHRDDQLFVPGHRPNGRLVEPGGVVDLGGGDRSTLDEIARIAGSSWADVEPLPKLLQLSVDQQGSALAVEVKGELDADLGVMLCPVGAVTPSSPSADYMGQCDLLMPVDFQHTGPLRLQDGAYRESFDIPSHRAGGGAWVVAVFAKLSTNEMKVAGMLDVVLEPFSPVR